jgi:hypothetical protein
VSIDLSIWELFGVGDIISASLCEVLWIYTVGELARRVRGFKVDQVYFTIDLKDCIETSRIVILSLVDDALDL